MTGVSLDPIFAAELASNVYLIKDQHTRKGFELKYKKTFELDDSKMVMGKTGGYIINKPHVMAFMAKGNDKAYPGQAFIAIKGTASLYDALTDLNTGVKTSHTGSAIHQGFHYAFDSILNDLRVFLGSLQGVSTIHCVGHSLGGAIATLAANWIKASGRAGAVRLYTFGSPRVGLQNFAAQCTNRMQSANIYRAYHQTDPVAMVPTWPFHHVPTFGDDYLMFSPASSVPWEYHFMKHYINSVKQAGSWGAIKSSRPQGHMDAAVERWLKSDGVVSLTANTLELMNAALLWVLKKVAHAAGILVVGTAASAFTLLDRLAMFMAKAAKVASDLSIWVFKLIRKMARLVGIVVTEGTDLTVVFIRMVFLRLHSKISDMIWNISKRLV